MVKLSSLGIRDDVLSWIKSFLFNRREQVMVSGRLSTPYAMPSGVPQGSVLGPLVFLAFVNDVDNCLTHTKILKYADDMKLYLEISDSDPAKSQEGLQEDLEAVSDWLNVWELNLATNKCTVVHFGRSNPKCSYSLCGSALKESSGEKDLGVYISNDLRWDKHVTQVVRKAEGVLASLSRSFVSRSPAIFLQLFKAFVRPHLEYASVVWSPYLVKDIKKLERVQRRATRRVYTVRKCSYSERLTALQLDSLDRRRLFADLLEIFKMKCNMSIDFNDFFTISSSKTRCHAFKVHTQFCKHDFRKHFFSLRSTAVWNSLPPEVVECNSVKVFKSMISNAIPL